MAKLNDIAVKAEILARRGNGETYRSIAKDFDVTEGGLRLMVLNHEETIKQIQEKLFADNIENYAESLELDVKNSKSISQKYHDGDGITPSEVAYKATTNKAMNPILIEKGIHPNNAFIQMNIDNSKNINIDKDVFKLLSKGFHTGFVQMHDMKEIEGAEVVE